MVGSDTGDTVIGSLCRERALAVRPTLGEDRRCHTLGSARGVGIADSESRALDVVGFFIVHVRAGGEGAEFVSKALSRWK